MHTYDVSFSLENEGADFISRAAAKGALECLTINGYHFRCRSTC